MLKLAFNNEYIVTEAPIPSLTNRIPELRPAHITHVLKWSELIRNLLDNMIKLLLLPWFEVVRKNLCCELHLPRRSGHWRSEFTAKTEIHTHEQKYQHSNNLHFLVMPITKLARFYAQILIRQVRFSACIKYIIFKDYLRAPYYVNAMK